MIQFFEVFPVTVLPVVNTKMYLFTLAWTSYALGPIYFIIKIEQLFFGRFGVF